MHDTAQFLARNIPTACICTEPFVSAARVHAQMLQWGGYEAIAIPHPLQTLTPEAVRSRADSIAKQVVELLCSTNGEQ